MNVQELKNRLSEQNIAAVVTQSSEESPTEQLDVILELQEISDPVLLHVKPIQSEENQFSQCIRWEFQATIPASLDDVLAGVALEMLPDINFNAPLMGFNLHPSEEFVYFRHIALLPNHDDSLAILVELVWLIYYTLDTYAYAFIALGQAAEIPPDLDLDVDNSS